MLVEKVSAVLREAGYRSPCLYTCEAHQQHRRLFEDVPISEPTLLALQDANRAVNRGLCPLTRANEIRLDLWDQLQPKITARHQGVALTGRGRDPVGGLFTGEVATHFLLREIELALLDLHSDTISGNISASSVAVRHSA